MLLQEKDVNALFTLAGFEVLSIRALVDGYGINPSNMDYYKKPPRCCWWLVETKWGMIEIGNRKRVISIDWKDTPLREEVTEDEVTSDKTSVHAWSIDKCLVYLTTLHEKLMSEYRTIENGGSYVSSTKCPFCERSLKLSYNNDNVDSLSCVCGFSTPPIQMDMDDSHPQNILSQFYETLKTHLEITYGGI